MRDKRAIWLHANNIKQSQHSLKALVILMLLQTHILSTPVHGVKVGWIKQNNGLISYDSNVYAVVRPTSNGCDARHRKERPSWIQRASSGACTIVTY